MTRRNRRAPEKSWERTLDTIGLIVVLTMLAVLVGGFILIAVLATLGKDA